jgi:hypothetical protein
MTERPSSPEVAVVSINSQSRITTGVIDHMNTKMILAALAVSLSLAACAKKEAPAETPPPAAEAAPAPADAAPPADAMAPPADTTATPPADAPPAEAPKQ